MRVTHAINTIYKLISFFKINISIWAVVLQKTESAKRKLKQHYNALAYYRRLEQFNNWFDHQSALLTFKVDQVTLLRKHNIDHALQ